MSEYPAMITPVNHIAPCPRRVRAYIDNIPVVDTTHALYVWEWEHYPQYYLPLDDVLAGTLIDEDRTQHTGRGSMRLHALRLGDTHRPSVARVLVKSPLARLNGTVRFDWAGLDSWFEEDEQVFVHPRNPYVRVDALRTTRTVRVELDGVVLAESSSPVLVFETGLPTRTYFPRTEVAFEHLVASDTVTACPYKGTTTGYWSVKIGDALRADLAWAYDFPTRQLLPIAGLVAFYDEKVDTFIDGVAQDRPVTHFS